MENLLCFVRRVGKRIFAALMHAGSEVVDYQKTGYIIASISITSIVSVEVTALLWDHHMKSFILERIFSIHVELSLYIRRYSMGCEVKLVSGAYIKLAKVACKSMLTPRGNPWFSDDSLPNNSYTNMSLKKLTYLLCILTARWIRRSAFRAISVCGVVTDKFQVMQAHFACIRGISGT